MALVLVDRVVAALRERVPPVLFRIVAFPVSLLFGILASSLALLARAARLRPNFASISFPSWPFSRPPSFDTSPQAASARFVSYIKQFQHTQPTYGPSTSKSPSASSINFYSGSYNDALQTAKSRLNLFVPILISSKHQDTAQFIKSVLYNPDLIAFFQENSVLVWGGDILESDAYNTSQILHAHEYPFLAFISLSKPSHNSTLGQTSPKMTVHSRLSGDSLTATAIISHMQTAFIPRTRAFLSRLRKEQFDRENERRLRAQQDEEFRRAQERDRANVLAKMRAQEEERARVAQAKAAEEERRQFLLRKEKLHKNRKAWRAWARQNIIAHASQEGDKSETTRIVLRFPDGTRIVRVFRRDQSLRLLYVWADCLRDRNESMIPPNQVENPENNSDYKHEFSFRLATSFPRSVIHLDERQIKDIDELVPSGNIAVEDLEDDDEEDEEEEDDGEDEDEQ